MLMAFAPFITPVIDKSGFKLPLATLKLRVAPFKLIGAEMTDVVALVLEVTSPFNAMEPVPEMVEPVKLTEPAVTLFAPIANVPALTFRAPEIMVGDAKVTVVGFAMARLATVAGRPLPTPWEAVPL